MRTGSAVPLSKFVPQWIRKICGVSAFARDKHMENGNDVAPPPPNIVAHTRCGSTINLILIVDTHICNNADGNITEIKAISRVDTYGRVDNVAVFENFALEW